MTYDEWVEQFLPIKNPLNSGRGYDDTLFETYGEDVEFVRIANDQKVWTLIEGDSTTVIASGWHTVNRLGYFITEVPFEGDFLEILVSEEETTMTTPEQTTGEK